MQTAVESYLQSLPQSPEAPEPPEVKLEQPRNADHGDWACSVAMRLAKPLRSNPFAIAESIAAAIPANELIDTPEVARPGFINLRLSTAGAGKILGDVMVKGKEYGQSDAYVGQRVLVEFVSANPTGPLHIGHCRGAVVGDSLARLFVAAGYAVSREYYYNDAGVQMQMLGHSLKARYLQALGEDAALPEGGYQGDYMIEIAEQLKAEHGDSWKSETAWKPFTDYATTVILKLIEADLERMRIHFDTWFSETTLHDEGKVAAALQTLESKDQLYESEGARWLRSEQYGDEKDRVVIKTDGNYTYLAPDIAYHAYKFERGFDRLIDVLGADHHGYIPRLKAAIQALGYQPEQLDVPIVQMVAIERGGKPAKLSTRQGDFITLKEVLDEIGVDVTRFLFLTRAADSQMVFDLDQAKEVSMENPVYYVQYAHARCCQLMAKAEELGHGWTKPATEALDQLTAAEEKAIVRQIDRFEHVILDCVHQAEPMPMTAYLRDLATAFHSYYSAGNRDAGLRVVQPDSPELTQVRLTMIAALRQTLANGLALLGVTPAERL